MNHLVPQPRARRKFSFSLCFTQENKLNNALSKLHWLKVPYCRELDSLCFFFMIKKLQVLYKYCERIKKLSPQRNTQTLCLHKDFMKCHNYTERPSAQTELIQKQWPFSHRDATLTLQPLPHILKRRGSTPLDVDICVFLKVYSRCLPVNLNMYPVTVYNHMDAGCFASATPLILPPETYQHQS